MRFLRRGDLIDRQDLYKFSIKSSLLRRSDYERTEHPLAYGNVLTLEVFTPRWSIPPDGPAF